MTQAKNYLAVLGLSTGADLSVIKQTFRRLAFRYHPDRNPNDVLALTRFREVTEAYAALTQNQELFNAITHDNRQASNQETQGASSYFTDFLFSKKISLGSEIRIKEELRFDISLEEARMGFEKKVELLIEKECGDCLGQGSLQPEAARLCSYCFGFGDLEVGSNFENCPKCLGRGQILLKPCSQCVGMGFHEEEKKFTLFLPKKIEQDQILKLQTLLGNLDNSDQSQFILARDYYIRLRIDPTISTWSKISDGIRRIFK